jgi:hypothetical protein
MVEVEAIIDVIGAPEALNVTDLVHRIATFRAGDLCLRYNLGRVIHQCRYHPSAEHGRRAIACLAATSGMAPSTLRRYARVSEVIKPIAFHEILQLRGPSGLPLSWSHIEELAECRNHRFRLQCARDAAARALSVSELRRRLRLTGT